MSLFAGLKATPRDEAAIESSRIRVPKDQRGTGAEKRKVCKTFLEAMPTGIYALRDASEIASGKDTNNVFDMKVRANQMKEGLIQYNCLEVLTSVYKIKPGTTWVDKMQKPNLEMDPVKTTEPVRVDLFSDAHKLTWEQVLFHVELLHLFGDDDNLKN